METNSQFITGLVSKSSLKSINELIERLKIQCEEIETLQISETPLYSLQTSVTKTTRNYETVWQKIWNIFNQDVKNSTLALLKSKVSAFLIKKFGLNLLKKNVVERPWHGTEFTRSLSIEDWTQLKTSFSKDARFHPVFQKIKIQYENNINKKIEAELQQVTIPVDGKLKASYRTAYYQKPISFNEFLEQNQNTANSSISNNPKSSQTEAKQIRAKYEQALEQKKLETEKKEQEKKFDNYQSYFTMDERELARAKRQGDLQRRAVTKKSRRGKFGEE